MYFNAVLYNINVLNEYNLHIITSLLVTYRFDPALCPGKHSAENCLRAIYAADEVNHG